MLILSVFEVLCFIKKVNSFFMGLSPFPSLFYFLGTFSSLFLCFGMFLEKLSILGFLLFSLIVQLSISYAVL